MADSSVRLALALDRAMTETYVSPLGATYRLLSQVYAPSTCLYHAILDANQAFAGWATAGFDRAIQAYQATLADKNLKACGTIQNELAALQDFARFRLVVATVAAGKASQAQPIKAQIVSPALLAAADAFLNSYRSSGSILQACRDVTTYATANPAAWQFMADWGYANPTFTAADLCPLR